MTFYPINPVAAPRLTQRDKWLKRPAVMLYFAFREEVRLRGVEVPIPSRVIFWMPMPDSWSKKKKKLMNVTPHLARPDIDNLLKAWIEAAFPEEDSIVWSIWSEKRWSCTPGIEVLPL